MEKPTAIDLDALKSKYNHDSLPLHLWRVALDCKRRRDAFWRHYRKMKIRSNIVSIPLLILSSLTGLTSVAQLGTSTSDNKDPTSSQNISLPVVITIFGVSSAVLTALQKYLRYSERAEHSKHMAKNYGRVARRIENTLVLVESSAIKLEPGAFLKFMEEVQKDTESLFQETDDMPKELITSKKWYESVLIKMASKKKESDIEKCNDENVNTESDKKDSDKDCQVSDVKQLAELAMREAQKTPSHTTSSVKTAYNIDDIKRDVYMCTAAPDSPACLSHNSPVATHDVVRNDANVEISRSSHFQSPYVNTRLESIKTLRDMIEKFNLLQEEACLLETRLSEMGDINNNESVEIKLSLAKIKTVISTEKETILFFARKNGIQDLCDNIFNASASRNSIDRSNRSGYKY